MSNPIVRYAIARENGFFKVEQEADIQRHRQRMVNAGHIEDIARGSFGPKRTQTFEQSAKTFEVLAEVLQQQARVDAADAAQRQMYERKVRGELPTLTEAEMQQYRSALYGVAAAVGHAPKLSLSGRHRYGALYAPASGGGAVPPREAGTWSAQAQEAARRAYMAGMAQLCSCVGSLTDRATSLICEKHAKASTILVWLAASWHTINSARSLLYGSALGIGGVVLLGTVTLRAAGISSPTELRERLQSTAQPLGDSVRETLSPVKARMQATIQGWLGLSAEDYNQSGETSGPDTEFTRSLGRRLHRRVGSQLQGISSLGSEKDRS